MACADVFVSPVDNIQETFGLTPLEAMASGVPQVVSDWSGYRDTVVHGETGLLVPTHGMPRDTRADLVAAILSDAAVPEALVAASTVVDLEALTSALLHLWRHPEQRAAMSEASRRRVNALYAWPKVVAEHEALWAALHERARHDPAAAARVPAYSALFAGYATEPLDSLRLLGITPDGREWLAGKQRIPADRRWEPFLSMELAKLLLSTVEKAGAIGDPLCYADLRDLQIGNAGSGPDWLPRHVLWLLKHGFMRQARPNELVATSARMP